MIMQGPVRAGRVGYTIKLTQERKTTLYLWTHPDDGERPSRRRMSLVGVNRPSLLHRRSDTIAPRDIRCEIAFHQEN
jgi:hypothetical protein